MIIPEFIIVADRGSLKAFSVETTPARKFVLRPVITHRIEEAHGRYQDKVTDQAGSFPNNGSNGHANSIAEKMTLDAEMQMRCFREAAHLITELLQKHNPNRWAFAAPSEINGAILDGLDHRLHQRLVRNIPKDIVKVGTSKLLSYFDL